MQVMSETEAVVLMVLRVGGIGKDFVFCGILSKRNIRYFSITRRG